MTRSAISRRNTLIPRRVEVHVEGKPYVLAEGDRVAFVASYAPTARVSRSLNQLIIRLRELDYDVVLVRASGDDRPLVWPEPHREDFVVLRKPNLGYDFGSWAIGMDRYPMLLSRPFVLLVNDSLAGPFENIDAVIGGFESDTCDVWGATRSKQFMPHLQSYLLGFKNGILLDRAIKTFWNNLPLETEKMRIVEAYEMAFARLLFSEGFVTSAFVEPEQLISGEQNPTIDGWRRLLDLGFPFVKRTIITNPSLVPDGEAIAATVHAKFDTDLADWL